MATSFDVKAESGIGGGSSVVNTPITIAANSGRVLIAGVGVFNAAAPTTITCKLGAVSMTQITSSTDTSGNVRVYLFGLKNPNSGASTIQAVVNVAPSGLVAAGWSWFNADSTVGWNNSTFASGTSTSATLTITTNNGDAVVAMAADNNGTTTPTISNLTSDFEDRAFNGNYHGGHALSSAASIAAAWNGLNATGVGWTMAGVNIPQSGAAATGSNSPNTMTLVGVQ